MAEPPTTADDLPAGLPIVLQTVSPTEVVAFGRAEELDLLGPSKATVASPFIGAMRAAALAAPQFQGVVDGLTGRVVPLTAESAQLLRRSESMRTTVLTGVVRNPQTGKIAGRLTFINPQSVAGLAGSLPAIAGGAAMQLQLARIEKALEGLKQDLGYLIRHQHLHLEADIETNLDILHDVYATAQRHGVVDDDQWDRVANVEASVRSLNKETKKHLRSLDEALDTQGAPLPVRVAQLNRALDDDRADFWVRAHVHAELALTRWDAVYLLRQADQHPDELGLLVDRLHHQVDDRQQALAMLANRIRDYLASGAAIERWTDRLRIVRRAKLRGLLHDLELVMRAFPPGSDRPADAIPLGDGTHEPAPWRRVLSDARALPQAATPIIRSLTDRIPAIPVRRHQPPERD